MRKFKLFFAFLLMSVLSIGQMWGADVTTTSDPAPAGTYVAMASNEAVAAGDTIIVVYETGTRAMSTTQNSNNRGFIAVTISNTTPKTVVLDGSTTAQALTVASSSTNGKWTLYTGLGYLYAPSYNSGTSNHLKTFDASKDGSGGTWGISYNSIEAVGNGTRRFIRYNTNNNIFSCYASNANQTADITIYKKAHKVFYQGNGGSTSCTTSDFQKSNATVTVCTAEPTLDNFNFTGWTATIALTNASTSATIAAGNLIPAGTQIKMPTKDLVLTAQWEAAGGCSSEVAVSEGATTNGSFTLSASSVCADGEGGEVSIASMTPTGCYEFDEIEATVGTPDNVNMKVTGITAATTITVKFKKKTVNTYIDEVQDNGSQEFCGTHEAPKLTDKAVNTTGTAQQQHFHFVGWVTEANRYAATDLNVIAGKTEMTADGTTYYAVWAKQASAASFEYDVINNAATSSALGNTGTTNWASGFILDGSTGAKYYIYSMGTKNTTNALQWNNNGYLYCSQLPTSGAKLYSVAVTRTSGKNIGVYASDEVYDAAPTGSALATMSSSTSTDVSYDFEDDYYAIALKGVHSSTSISSITITYGEDATYNHYRTLICDELGEMSKDVIDKHKTDVTLKWSNLTGVTAWNVQRKLQGAADNTYVDVTPSSTSVSGGFNLWTITGLTAGTTYTFKIQATAFGTGVCTDVNTWTVDGTTQNNFVVTVESNDDNWGTAVLSGTTITATPEDGYRVSQTTPYEVSVANAVDVAQNGNVFTISNLTNTCTITINFEAIPTYTVNWYINGNIEATQTNVAGTDLNVPSDFSSFTDCADYHFIGWKDGSAIDGYSTSKPTLANVGTEITEEDKNYYAVFAEGTPASTTNLFTESLSSGIATTGWTFNDKCYTASSTVRLSTGDDPGVMSSPALTSLDGDATLTFEVKGWGGTKNEEGQIDVSASTGTFSTTSFTTSSFDDFEEVSTTLSGGNETTVITFTGTAGKRIYVKNVKVIKTIAENFSKYYTTCPQATRVNLTASDVEHGSISFAVGGSAVTNPSTKDAVEVEIVAVPVDGYELTAVSLSTLSGASYNSTTGKIELAQGTDGDLTVTATFSAIDYAVTMTQTGGANATLTGAKDDAHYTETIYISAENKAGYQFLGWEASPEVTFADATALSTSFTMPNEGVEVTAKYAQLYTISFYVGSSTVAHYEVTTWVGNTIDLSSIATPTKFADEYPNFIGWSENKFSPTNSEPTIVNGTITVSGDDEYYAVFGNALTEETNNYAKVNAIESGKNYLIVAEYGTKLEALHAAVLTKDYWLKSSEVTSTNDIIASDNAERKWQITVNAGVAHVYNAQNSKYLAVTFASGQYYNAILSGDACDLTITANAGAWNISGVSNTETIYVIHAATYPEFIGGDEAAPIYLYKQIVNPTVWATYAAENVTVSYYDNVDNTNPIHTALVEKGNNTVDLTYEPDARAGYTFTGWSLTTNGGVEASLTNIDEDTPLYAIWAPNHTTTLKFYAINTTTPIATYDQTQGLAYAIPNMSGSLPAAPDGFTFDGWSASQITDEAASYTKVTSVTPAVAAADNEMPLYAVYNRAVPGSGDYVKVTTARANWSGQYLIVNEASNIAFNGNLTEGALPGTYTTVDVTISASTIAQTTQMDNASFTFAQVEGGYSIRSHSGYYIGRNSNSTGMDVADTYSAAYKNTIGVDEITSNNGYLLRYNNASNQDRFRYYSGESVQGIALYRKDDVVNNYTTNPQLSIEVIRDGLFNGKWGTLCPTQDVTDVEGAEFYLISYLEEKDGMPYNVVFDEIVGPNLQAGKPYFFIANANEIRGHKTGDVVTSAGAGVNGFYGYIGATSMELTDWHTNYDATAEKNTFVIYNNSVMRINQAGTMLKSERCYININATEPSRTEVAKAYGRRRITMQVAGTNVATGMDELNASETPVKVMIDGKFYILRGEKMYDATGKLVK